MRQLCAAAIILFMHAAAHAQLSCQLPTEIPKPRLQSVDCANRISPDSYVLALSWSPQHCAEVNAQSPKHHFQCALNNFGFVVHGLWGQRSRARGKCEQPRNCSASLVSEATIKQTLCIMPGVDLIQGEWQKHGSCTGMSEIRYFEKTRILWASLQQPELTRLLNAQDETTAGAIAEAFVAANRQQGLVSSAVAVRVGPRNVLKEVLICYDHQFHFSACDVGKTPARQRIKVTRRRGH